MRNRNALWKLILGAIFLVLTTAACRSTVEEETTPQPTNAATLTPEIETTVVAQSVTATPDPFASESPPAPPKPTPQPTSSIIAINGQRVGSEAAGMEMAMPPGWTDLSADLDVAAAANPLGLTVLLLADSGRTGRNVLAGKSLSTGAFSVGMMVNQPLAAADPATALTRIVASSNTAVTPLNQAQPIAAGNGFGAGAVIEVSGDLLGLFTGDSSNLRTRLLLFPAPSGSSPDGRTAVLFLFSAPNDKWEAYAPAFAQMAETIVIHDAQSAYALSAGAVNVRGSLLDNHGMTGKLNQGVTDVWTFIVDESRYATISLSPEDAALDLTLTIISPSGQTVARVDGGYAGAPEIAADILLTENGRYAIEISDFFGESGRYIISLVLNEEPKFNGGGEIRPGEGIQSVLPVNSQHIWTFEGAAGRLVSIVLTPEDNQMDAILNLYGPNGQRLVALDEGFSGDAEVISGFELPVTGVYSILVTSFSSDGGPYTLALDEGGEATQNFHDAGDLVYGDTQSESLRSSEAHAWFFAGRAGDEVKIIVRPLNELLDLDVWLFDPNVERLAALDEFAAGETETLEQVLPEDGEYLILVREFFGEAGSYEVNLSAAQSAAPSLAGRVNYGETVTGALPAGTTALWQFNGNVNDVIDVELIPENAADDVVLLLRDPNGVVVLELDEAQAGQSERLTSFTITSDGQWGIIVKDFFDEGLTYSLTVRRAR